jgi:hypothetical protein
VIPGGHSNIRSISSVGLDGLLYLMGISEREIRQA